MEATREIKITTGYEFNNKSESVFIRFVFCYCWMNVCVFVWPSLSSISGRIMQLSKLNKPWARNVWVATTRLSHFSSPKIVFFSQNFFSQFFVSSWNYHLTVKGVTNLIQWIFFCFLSLSTSYKLWIDFFPSKSKEEEKEKKKRIFRQSRHSDLIHFYFLSSETFTALCMWEIVLGFNKTKAQTDGIQIFYRLLSFSYMM